MAKLLNSFFSWTGSPGKTYGRDLEAQSLFFSLGGTSGGNHSRAYCFCQGGCEYNPAGFDSDIPRYKWQVPDGITSATFQLWGEGGSGAGGACCMQGVSGGSGAFAQKTVDVVAGDVYTLCLDAMIPSPNCAGVNFEQHRTCHKPTCIENSATALNFGRRGLKAYVLGTGLTNFCAEGGNPGVVRGYGWISTCNGTSAAYSGGPIQFKCYENLYLCDIIGRSTEDSANDIYHRACYYGADDGGRGNQSYVQANCCNTCAASTDFCAVQHMIAFTGNQPDFAHGWTGTAEGGWSVQKMCSSEMGGFGWPGNKAINNHTPYMGATGTHLSTTIKWGAGGLSSTTQGGGICCGATGGPNAIRVIFS